MSIGIRGMQLIEGRFSVGPPVTPNIEIPNEYTHNVRLSCVTNTFLRFPEGIFHLFKDISPLDRTDFLDTRSTDC